MDFRADLQVATQPCSASGSFRNLGKPPLPSSRPSTGTRLAPLGADTPATPMPDCLESLSLSPELVRSHSGHVGVVRTMRRSLPSPVRHSYPLDTAQAKRLPWARMAELAGPSWDTQVDKAEPSTPRRPSKDVRLGRVRRSADSGAGGYVQQRGQSCAARSSRADLRTIQSQVQWPEVTDTLSSPTDLENLSEVPCTPNDRRPARCDSMPPTGTAKADGDAANDAKAKAVATLQRLFFEEMAKGGQDASGAAAKALLRMSEAPQEPMEYAPEVTTPAPCRRLMLPPPEVEIPSEAPEVSPEPETEVPEVERPAEVARYGYHSQPVPVLEAGRPIVPRRPCESMGSIRRPRALSRVAVRN